MAVLGWSEYLAHLLDCSLELIRSFECIYSHDWSAIQANLGQEFYFFRKRTM